jgi:hypothetical protein
VQLGAPFGSADEKLLTVGKLYLTRAARLSDDLHNRFQIDGVLNVVRRHKCDPMHWQISLDCEFTVEVVVAPYFLKKK